MDAMVKETRAALKSPLWNILGCDWDAAAARREG
jgi:hypothetical protein